MKAFIFASILAVGLAAYARPQADYDEDDYGGGGYGGPARPSAPPPPPPARAQAAAPAHQNNPHDDSAYDVPQEEWKPYSFSYSADGPDGKHAHQQQADSKNRVTGQYSIMLADGRMRIVKYVADENGFRAQIVSNEQGTESKNPADVTIQSSAPTGEEAAQQHGSGGHSNSRFDKYTQSPRIAQTNVKSNPTYEGQNQYSNQQHSSYSKQTDSSYDQSYGNNQANNYPSNDYSQDNSYQPAQPVQPKYESKPQHSSYTKSQSSSYSSGHSYASNQIPPANIPGPVDLKSNTQSYADAPQDNYDNTYQSHSSSSQFHQPASHASSGSYGNDVQDIEDIEDKGYYSGTGSAKHQKPSRHNSPSYG